VRYKLLRFECKCKSLDQTTTIVDVTYKCNAKCKYCQWGNPHNPLRKNLPLEDICLSAQTIEALGTKRVVLSGGEPRLHPEISQILSHYRKIVDSAIVISNGYGLDRIEVDELIGYGATGISVSLDSVNSSESMLTRGTPLYLHRQITTNLKRIGECNRNFEFGLNAVVSHPNANWKSIGAILNFGQSINVDYVKFQPVFDDGYLQLNAPHLMLTASDSVELSRIGDLLDRSNHPLTNPPGFWKNIADLAAGRKLSSTSCGLGGKRSIAVRNNLRICYWLDTFSYGDTASKLEAKKVVVSRTDLEKLRENVRSIFIVFARKGCPMSGEIKE